MKWPRRSKYGAERANGFASKSEASRAAELGLLLKAKMISDLEFQKPFLLIPGRGKVRGITYIADFTYRDAYGVLHVEDVKGFRTPVYLLKRKMLYLLHGITVEEITKGNYDRK